MSFCFVCAHSFCVEPEPYIPSAPVPAGYVQMAAPDGSTILVPQHLVHMYGIPAQAGAAAGATNGAGGSLLGSGPQMVGGRLMRPGAGAVAPFQSSDAISLTGQDDISQQPQQQQQQQGFGESGAKRSFQRARNTNMHPPTPDATTLAITNVSDELNNQEAIAAHFRLFGTVVHVAVKPDLHCAFVQMSAHEEAQAALVSPEPIMGDPGIRVGWSHKQFDAPEAVRLSFLFSPVRQFCVDWICVLMEPCLCDV